jgi:ankyrin repeat protein
LAAALTVTTTVTTLTLWNHPIGDDGATALAEALKVNTTVTTLNLSFNGIGADGAHALAEALKVNTTVTTLNLSFNGIDDNGARALAGALKVNTSVTTLNLWNNKIGDDGARALAEALKVNKTVTALDLSSNTVGDVGARALVEALQVNTTVNDLSLAGNVIKETVLAEAAAKLQANTGGRQAPLLPKLDFSDPNVRLRNRQDAFDQFHHKFALGDYHHWDAYESMLVGQQEELGISMHDFLNAVERRRDELGRRYWTEVHLLVERAITSEQEVWLDSDYYDAISWMRERGADVNATTGEGETVLDIAQRLGDDEAVKGLSRAGLHRVSRLG